jgi:hypothetical protein
MRNDLPALLASAKGGDLAAYAAIADRLEEMGELGLADTARANSRPRPSGPLPPGLPSSHPWRSLWHPGLMASGLEKKCRERGLIP